MGNDESLISCSFLGQAHRRSRGLATTYGNVRASTTAHVMNNVLLSCGKNKKSRQRVGVSIDVTGQFAGKNIAYYVAG